jgi:hypothetical protein
MKLKPNLLKVLEIVLHVLGFPLLLVIAVILNINVMSKSAQYGISGFVFIIVIALFAVGYYVAYFILTKQEKKRRLASSKQNASAKNLNVKLAKKADPARRTGLVLAIVAVCCLTGLWAFFDVVMPEPLATATSNTLFIEDLSDGWNERANVNQELLDTYITRAYYSGKLTQKDLGTYLKEGVKNKEVSALLDVDFASIDKNGYGTFIGPSIDFAQNNRMTISAIVHLLLDDRTPVSEKGERQDAKIPVTTFKVERSNPYQDSQLVNEKKIAVGGTYMYLRSNQGYILYNDSLDVAGTKVDGLIVLEDHVGYRKVEYLTANAEDSSFIYVVDANNGFRYSESVYVNDVLERETVIEEKDGGLVAHIYNIGDEPLNVTLTGSVEKTDKGYKINAQANPDTDDAVAFANVLMSAGANEIFDGIVTVDGWYLGVDDVVCLSKGKAVEYSTWDIFDMLGTDTTFDLPLAGITGLTIPVVNMTGGALLSTYKYAIDDVLSTVGAMLSDENIVGSDVYISLDTETGVLAITPCNIERGTLDYMKQAWLQNNGLIYIIVSLFSLRKLFLAFAGFLALISYLIGVVRELRFAGQVPEAEAEDSEDSSEEPSEEALVTEEVEGTDI